MADFKINFDVQQGLSGLNEIKSTLDGINKSLKDLTNTINRAFTGEAPKRAAQGTAELNSELKKTDDLIKRLNKRRQQLSQEEKAELVAAQQKQKRLRHEMEQTAKKGEQSIKRVTTAQKTLNNQVSLTRQLFLRLKSVMLTVFGAYAIIQGIRNTVNTVKEFELGMARVQAITGATADELERLSGVARVLATQGIFNPTEIAETQVQLAKFGFTVEEISQSLEGIISLATATGEGLSEAATLVSSSLRALGLSARETQRLVDVLGKSFTSSALDINKFRESAKFVLPLAREMGWTIEEVAATLGKLADSGISGSLAGTGLRQTFIQLWDASSDLSQVLGENIRTFDEFFDALEDARDGGVSFEKVLETIPTRAKTMFTVLWNNIDAIREFKDEMEDANGSINEMANVQLETLAGQLDRFKSAWQSLVTTTLQGGGLLTHLFRGLADELERMVAAIDPMAAALFRAGQRATLTISAALDEGERGSDQWRDALERNIEAIENKIKDMESNLSESNGFQVIDMAAAEAAGGVDKFFAKLAGLREELRLLQLELVGDELDEVVKDIENVVGAIDLYLQQQLKLLALEEQNMILRARRIEDEQAMEEQLLGIKTFFAIERLKLTIKYGELTEEEEAVMREQIIELEKTFNHDMLELQDKFYQQRLEEDIKAAENREKVYKTVNDRLIEIEKIRNDIELQNMKNAGATTEEIQRRRIEQLIELKERELEAAEAAEADITVIIRLREELKLLNAELAGVGLGLEESTKNIGNAYRNLAKEIIESLQTIVDAQVENTERLVDDLNTRIAETQRALDQEITLYTEGYANNVTAKRQELQELKNAREQAIKDREQAVRRQQTLEAVAQAANLFSAVAKTINTYASIPFVGFGIAAGVVAAFLGLFKASQNSIKNITQFETGGKVEGGSHAQGGVLIEAEGGEFVVRKSAYAKHSELVRAINEDDVPTINKHILSNTTFDKKGDKVIVDNAIWNKMYDLWEKNLGGENVQIVGTKKVVTRGIKKRIINV